MAARPGPEGDADALEIAAAIDPLHAAFGGGKCWKGDGSEQGKDGDYDEQFNEGEGLKSGAAILHRSSIQFVWAGESGARTLLHPPMLSNPELITLPDRSVELLM